MLCHFRQVFVHFFIPILIIYKYSHKKWKDSLETRAVLLVFLLEPEISGVACRKYIKTVKMASCCEDFLFGDGFDAGLAIFHSYCYSANVSESVEKIAADEKEHHKCSLRLLWL